MPGGTAPRPGASPARLLYRSSPGTHHDHVLPWLTGPQLSTLWRVPLGTVKRWAHEDSWPRTSTRPTRYDPDAAQRTYENRRVPGSTGV